MADISEADRAQLNKLEDIYKTSAKLQTPFVFLHPDEKKRQYTDDEMEALTKRDYETRLFITAANINTDQTMEIGGRTIFIRTHFTDNAEYSVWLNYVRDFFKANHTKNYKSAKVTLTVILTMCFQLDPSDYYTFATTLASGLSDTAKNTEFEIGKEMVANLAFVPEARMKFCNLMDVIFTKMARKRFLIDNEGSNTYRLAHCSTKFSKKKDKVYLVLPLLCFLLQSLLTAYVLLENIGMRKGGFANNIQMNKMPLAAVTFVYSVLVAWKGMRECKKAFHVYGKVGVLQMMDFFVNQILPLILSIAGTLVILSQDSYIEAVLNTAALLFIPEIDDELPRLLGLNVNGIIMNHLITESMIQYDKARKSNEIAGGTGFGTRNGKKFLQFGDYYITNVPEQGTVLDKGTLVQPYMVQKGYGESAVDILLPSNYINEDCLLTKISWKYAKFQNTSKPRLETLKLEKLVGDEKEKKVVIGKEDVVDFDGELEGLFIITQFQMSDQVIKLRVCGSKDITNFLPSFEYYSLWGMSVSARNIIRKEAAKVGDSGNHAYSSVDSV